MSKSIKEKRNNRKRRHRRVRAKVSGTTERPRLNVFKSNKYIHLQLIDDEAGKTLASASSMDSKAESGIEAARKAGKKLAEQAKKDGIGSIVFDRGGYKYHGQTRAVAEAVREAGVEV